MQKILSILTLLLINFNLFANELDSLFYQAFLMEDFDKMTLYVKQGANIDRAYANEQGVTLLHNFAFYGKIDEVKWWIANGADVNIQDNNGFTPLFYATMNQHVDICEILLQHGALTTHSAQNLNLQELSWMVGNPELGRFIMGDAKKPTDFNQLRRIIKLTEDPKEAIKQLKSAIKKVDSSLEKTNKFYTLFWLDMASVYNKDGEKDKCKEAIDTAFSRAQKHSYGTEIYYRALATNCDFWLNNQNVNEAFDSILICYKHMDAFHDYETKFIVSTVTANIAAAWSMREHAINIFFEALSYAEALKTIDSQVYNEFYYTTVLTICISYVSNGSAEGFDKALLFLEGLNSNIKNHQDDEIFNALYLFTKGAIFMMQGDYYEAKRLFKESAYYSHKIFGDKHDLYLRTVYYIAEINYMTYRIEESINIYSNILNIRQKNKTHDTYEGALAIKGLARSMLMSNILGETQYKYQTIDYLLYEAINIIHKTKGREHLDFVEAVTSLCSSLLRQNDTTQLREFYRIPLELTHKIVPRNNYRYQLALYNSSYLALYLGDIDYAYECLLEYNTLSKNDIIEHFFVLPQEQREAYWRTHHKVYYESFIPTFIHKNIANSPELSVMAYNNALFTKGLLLQTTNTIKNAIQNSADSFLINLYDSLQVNQLLYQEMTSHNNFDYDKFSKLSDKIFSIEQYLTSKCKPYADYKGLENSTWVDTQKALQKHQVAVEFIHFDYEKSDSVLLDYYVALVVTPNCTTPYYIPLFDVEEIRELVNVTNKDLLFVPSANGQILMDKIWKKILPYIPDNGEIIFSPDGILCELPIEYLPYNDTLSLSDKYNIFRCSSTKNIQHLSKNQSINTAILYGGISYDAEMDNLDIGLDTMPKNRCDVSYRGHYDYLKGAEEEVRQISQLLDINNIDYKRLSNQQATEESFKSLSAHSPRVIHIATHGFYWPEEKATRKDYILDKYSQSVIPIDSLYIDPLERCGLLFAGANLAMSGHSNEIPANVEDGILTAQEIANMDLSNTSLVVLSACETGNGDLLGDGVYGLQRAFKLAGVQSIIMSLWKVDDMATYSLMIEFYKAWMSGVDKHLAFHIAQNKTREKYPEPSYWAGFIMLD